MTLRSEIFAPKVFRHFIGLMVAMNSTSLSSEPSVETHRTDFLATMRAVPGAVAIVAAADGDDRTGMAATAWNSLCADPPMVLVCVNKSASVHDLIHRTRAFSLNVMAVDDQETVAIFSARRGLQGRDRFLRGRWNAGPAGQPLLTSAKAAFECDLVADHIYGTHSVFIGLVRGSLKDDDKEALLYLDGRFAHAAHLPDEAG